jgi:hypothetical protein
MRRGLLAALVASAALSLGAQGAGSKGDPIPLTLPVKEENPFGRFEIVSLGAFPIMLFYVGFAFDLERYVENGFDTSYAPWPFKGATSATLSDKERITRLSVALGSSLIIGGVDAYLHAKKVKAARLAREAAVDSGAEP